MTIEAWKPGVCTIYEDAADMAQEEIKDKTFSETISILDRHALQAIESADIADGAIENMMLSNAV